MRLVSLDAAGDRKWNAVFEIRGHTIKKLVWVHPAEILKPGLMYKTLKALREADRDAAYADHGKDFREHCGLTSNFWREPSDSELSGVDLQPLKRELERLD